jgi:CBS domain-containing protein
MTSEGPGELRDSKFGHLTIGTLMEPDVKSATRNSKAEWLASFMMEGFGSVPIVDDQNKLLGIVSEFDLLTALQKGKKLSEVSAGDIMTANPVSITKDTEVVTLINILQNNHLIRVPVVDAVGKLIGIVSRRDILRGYLQTVL